jgi:hypothetical protein
VALAGAATLTLATMAKALRTEVNEAKLLRDMIQV